MRQQRNVSVYLKKNNGLLESNELIFLLKELATQRKLFVL